jgi:hypothetical protein
MPAPPWRSRNRKPATARPLEILALVPLKIFVCSAIGDAILVALSCPRRPRAWLVKPTAEGIPPATGQRRQGGEPAPEIQIDPAAFVFRKAGRLTICFYL